MAFAVVSPDLHDRIALGIQAAIQNNLCTLRDPNNTANQIPASQVYKQDWPIPETGCMFPAIIVSVEGEAEEDDDAITFETDASIYPNKLRIVYRRDSWDQSFTPALKLWRKSISDFLRASATYSNCPEVYNVWCKRGPIIVDDPAAMDYVTSELLVQSHASYARIH